MPSSTAPGYNPTTAFTSFNPSAFPNLGTNLDTELENIETTLDAVQLNIADVRRSDGALANGIVRQESLHAEIYAGLNTPSVWATATAYVLRDSIVRDGVWYKCIVAHTSGTFSTDLAAGKWSELMDFADYAGPQLSDSTPAVLGVTATAGVGLTASRYDHVHQIPGALGPALTGTITSGTTAMTAGGIYRITGGTGTLPTLSSGQAVIVQMVPSAGNTVTVGRNSQTIDTAAEDDTYSLSTAPYPVVKYTGSGGAVKSELIGSVGS